MGVVIRTKTLSIKMKKLGTHEVKTLSPYKYYIPNSELFRIRVYRLVLLILKWHLIDSVGYVI